jgi:hypothetical protein
MTQENYLKKAFETIIQDAKIAEQWYVVLVEKTPFYGGPEEGGWWGWDTNVIAYKEYPTEEFAQAAAEQVRRLAKKWTDQSYFDYEEDFLRLMERIETYGLSAKLLPLEIGAPSKYLVLVTNDIPQSTFCCRRYKVDAR